MASIDLHAGLIINMHRTPVGSGKVSFDPYPFDLRPCRVQLLSRRLPKTSYENVETFRRAYFSMLIRYRLRSFLFTPILSRTLVMYLYARSRGSR